MITSIRFKPATGRRGQRLEFTSFHGFAAPQDARLVVVQDEDGQYVIPALQVECKRLADKGYGKFKVYPDGWRFDRNLPAEQRRVKA